MCPGLAGFILLCVFVASCCVWFCVGVAVDGIKVGCCRENPRRNDSGTGMRALVRGTTLRLLEAPDIRLLQISYYNRYFYKI